MQLIDKQSTINLLRLKVVEQKSAKQFYLYTDSEDVDDAERRKIEIYLLHEIYRVIPEFIDELEVIYDTNKID